jgi:serine phosphatase RsbU (regulator of sigma subunit)
LGWLPEAAYATSETAIEPGDYILLITDGIEESFSPLEQAFGRERVFQAVAKLADRPVAEQAKGILEAVRHFTGGHQHDDMSVLLARVTA